MSLSRTATTTRPTLRLEGTSASHVQGLTSAPSSFRIGAAPPSPEEASYAHTSVFRSAHMMMQIHSPSLKVLRREGPDGARSLPIFGDHDRVEGVLTLDPKACAAPGRVTISIEGAFSYIPAPSGSHASPLKSTQHVFYSSSLTPTSPTADSHSPRSSTSHSLRDAFDVIRKRPSLQTIGAKPKSYPFVFDIPQSVRPGEEMPPSFYSSVVSEGGIRGRAAVESAEVKYRVVARWDAIDGSENHAALEAPILFQPDSDFSSLDGLAPEPESWLEVPLRADRPINFQCAVTLPSPATFSRSASIPFFVVYTTPPRSAWLAREIATDATIAVTLSRQVTLKPALTPMPSPTASLAYDAPLPPLPIGPRTRAFTSPTSVWSRATPSGPPSSVTPPSSGSEEDAPHVPMYRRRLLKRAARSAPPTVAAAPPYTARPPSPPLPPLPSEALAQGGVPFPRANPPPARAPPAPPAVSDTRSIMTDMCVGFPKRPRHPSNRGQHGHEDRRHPSLVEHQQHQHEHRPGEQEHEHRQKLPDGLYKGRLQLNRNMLPGIDWAGLSVKYYLDVSVLFGQDEMRARVPVRIF